MIKIGEVFVNSYISKSKLPDADYVINPYVGCPHKCIYCYAEFMKRFCNHSEDWGDFIDIKYCDKPVSIQAYNDSSILFGSVTDAYNPFEKKYEITKKILENLKTSNAKIDILTKSELVLRDLDIFKIIKNIRIGISLNTLDDDFRKKIEPYASSIQKRINTLKKLKDNQVTNYLFMSPIFPKITDFKKIIAATKDYVDLFCFENLNLRSTYKSRVMELIEESYPEYYDLYKEIYVNNNMQYWIDLEKEITEFCTRENINFKIYFYHEKIKKV